MLREAILRVRKAELFFWTGRYLNSTLLSGQFGEQHACTAELRAELHGAVV